MRAAFSVVTVLLTGLVGSACGNHAPVTAGSADIVRLTGEKTILAGSSQIEFSYDLVSGLGFNVNISMSGVVDFTKHLGEFTGSAKSPEGDFNGILMRLVDNAIYLKMPPAFGNQNSTRAERWTKQDVSTDWLSATSDIFSQDPTLAFTFTPSAENVSDFGSEVIRGTPTSHFKMTLNVSGSGTLSNDRKNRRFPAEIWIDSRGRIRRLSLLDLPISATNSVARSMGHRTLMVELWDFGTPVSVSPPPPSEVSVESSGLSNPRILNYLAAERSIRAARLVEQSYFGQHRSYTDSVAVLESLDSTIAWVRAIGLPPTLTGSVYVDATTSLTGPRLVIQLM